MKKAQIYFLAILIIVLIIVIYLDYSASPGLTVIRAPENPNPATKEMETINFCGTDYQVEKIMIDGVDIIKRIAQLATEKPETKICEGIKLNYDWQKEFTTSLTANESSPGNFWLNANGPDFSIKPKENKIFLVDAFTYAWTELGTIK